MAFEYFVWYRVGQDPDAAELAVRTMMARLACRTGATGRLLKKRDEPRLWMEIYVGVAAPEAFETRLAQALDEFDVEMFLDGPRHTECFVTEAPIPAACAAAQS